MVFPLANDGMFGVAAHFAFTAALQFGGNTRLLLHLGACGCLKFRLGARQFGDRPAIPPHRAERDAAINKKGRQFARRYGEVKFCAAVGGHRTETVDTQHSSAGINDGPAAITRCNGRRMQKRFYGLRRPSG